MPAVKDVGEPGAREPHARFDEAAGGTRCQWPERPTAQAPPADPTLTLARVVLGGWAEQPVALRRLLSPTVWFLDGRTALPPARRRLAAGRKMRS
jgi:hypothetical protein